MHFAYLVSRVREQETLHFLGKMLHTNTLTKQNPADSLCYRFIAYMQREQHGTDICHHCTSLITWLLT